MFMADSDFITLNDVPVEFHFSRATIYRWRRDGMLTTYRQGKRRVLLSREELSSLMAYKEKVGVGSTGGEGRNEESFKSVCKDTNSSSILQNITVNNSTNDEENTIPTAANS